MSARERILTALRNGVVLRLTGSSFEERDRPRGTGPTYPLSEVMRLIRAGRAWPTCTATEDEGNEFVVGLMPQRRS